MNATYLWESWSNVSQVLSTNGVHYAKRAAHARDAKVKRWIKDDGLHKTSAIVVVNRRAQEAKSSSVQLRAMKAFAKQNESEQGLVINEIQSIQAPRREANYLDRLTRASSTSSRISLA